MKPLHFITHCMKKVSALLAVAQLVLTSAPAAAQDYRAIAAAVIQNAIGPLTGSHSGTPYNDLVEYLPHMSYVEGETAGFDTSYPISCGGTWPGSDEVIMVNCCSNPDYDVANKGARGDRVILGTSAHGAFFRRGADNVDNDYCHITNFDYGQGGVPNGDDYLIAAHRTSDLGNVWRHFYNPFPGSNTKAAETWGGIAIDPVANRAFTAGWWFNFSALSSDGFACAYDGATGGLAWPAAVTIGSAFRRTDWSLGSAVDSAGNYYVAGYTTGNLAAAPQGQGDLFIRKFTSTGTVVWSKQWGTSFTDSFRRLVIDENNILFAVGYTHGDLAGTNRDSSHRTADIYIARLDGKGNLLGERQLGTEEEDRGYPGVKNGILYLAGTTEGAMTGPNQGAWDSFGMRLSADTLVPFPSAALEIFSRPSGLPQLRIMGTAGLRWQIQRSPELLTWIDMEIPVVTLTNGMAAAGVLGLGTNQFYRARWVP